MLTGIYLVACLIFALLFWFFYRDFFKANLIAFFIMCFYFFFGAMHDFLKKNFHESVITKYSFLLPATFIVFILILILLKKREKTLLKISQYLNILLLLLLLVDLGWLVSKTISENKKSFLGKSDFIKCDTCSKPDIYFLLADEYAGFSELKDIFQFDNSEFENELRSRGFYIIRNSYSNYNYTPFSLASILNMEYMELTDTNRSGNDLVYSYRRIKNNKVLQFLEDEGYKFYNYSIFDFEGQPARTRENFLPPRTRLITDQTFFNRLQRDIGFNMITKLKSKHSIKVMTYDNKNNNEHFYQLTWDIAELKTNSPKFVYTHLMMPHYPYYDDKNGKEQPFEKLVEGNQVNTNAYIEYLQYCNQKIVALIDHLQKSSVSPPVIILMGDHGFRHFRKMVGRKYYFMNLSAICLPNKNYSGFYDGVSSVNQFRIILNNLFNQKFQILKDSAIYLKD